MTKKLLSLLLILVIVIGALTAVPAQAASKISLSKTSLTLSVGDIAGIKLNNADASKVKWSSSNKDVASVTIGIVKGVKAGKATVTATYNNKKYTCAVTVKAKAQAASKISLSKTSITMTVGDIKGVKLNNADASKVNWSSSDKKIVTVAMGLIKAKKAGKATVTAKYNNKKYTCTVTVKAKAQTNSGNSSKYCSACGGTGDCGKCTGSGKCHKCHGRKKITCNYCSGGKCYSCGGKGYVYKYVGKLHSKYTCPTCHGKRTCQYCKGTRYTKCSICKGKGKCTLCGGSGNCKSCRGTGKK